MKWVCRECEMNEGDPEIEPCVLPCMENVPAPHRCPFTELLSPKFEKTIEGESK